MAHWGLALLSLACLMLYCPGASAASATKPGVIRATKKCVPSKKNKYKCPKKKTKPTKAKKTWQVDQKYTIEKGCSRKCWPIDDDNSLGELDLEWEGTSVGDCVIAGFVAKEGYDKVSLEREDDQGDKVCNAVWENADSEDFKKYGVLEYKDTITVSASDDGSDIENKDLGDGQKMICVGNTEQCNDGEVQVKFNTSGPSSGGLIAGIVIGCVCLFGSIGFALYAYFTKAFCFGGEGGDGGGDGEKEAPMLVNDEESGGGGGSDGGDNSGDDGGDD